MTETDLIKEFIKVYSSAQIAIDSNDKTRAEKKYHGLLQVYNKIKDSNLDHSHKKIAYSQIQKVYKGVQGIDTRTSINKYAVFVAIFVIILSLAVLVRPTIFGLAVLEKGLYQNHAPIWTQDTKTISLDKTTTTIDLNQYFTDPDGDELTYLTKHQKGLMLSLSNNQLTITNDGAEGKIPLELIASDGRYIVKETITVNIN
ncbi:hypothetical protein GF358_03465 [Candidatus Woesearchaeota archaeon]|nr:hypothetical protein [Candidatus Woesearchaeota archaeon]